MCIGAIAGIAALSLVGCSSSSQSTGRTTSSGASDIKLLQIGEYTGTAFGFPEMADGAKAAVAAANAHGGIGGQKIQFATCDDKGDPNVAAACARKAVSDKVSAVLGSISLFGAPITSMLAAAKIPYIGALPVVPQDTSSPIAYPLDGGVPVTYAAKALGLIRSGCKKIGVFITDLSLEEGSTPFITNAAKASGAVVTAVEKVPQGAADFTPYVTALLASKPECMAVTINSADLVKAITAIRDSTRPSIPIAITISDLPLPVVQALKGQANGIQTVSSSLVPGPKTPTFAAQLKAENPKAPVDNPAEVAWSAATAFVDISRKISGKITAASVLAEISRTAALSIETYPRPINFSKLSGVVGYPHLFNFQTLIYVVKDNGYTLPDATPINTQPALSSH